MRRLVVIAVVALTCGPEASSRVLTVGGKKLRVGTTVIGTAQFPPAPPMPTPPSALLYFAPNGGFGMGSSECRFQLVVDVNQNAITAGQIANGTCIRETDGLGVEFGSAVDDLGPAVLKVPGHANHYGLMGEAASKNWLLDSYQINSGNWADQGTPVVIANAWSGPFSHYRVASGFESIEDDAAGASEGRCQTFADVTAGPKAFTCTLRSGTLSAARLTITGTGASGADRTCAISGLDSTLSRDDRKGCVTTSSYAGTLTAVTVCVLPGANDAATGTVGVVDCQVEKLDHVTSYIPTTAAATARLVSGVALPVPPATLTLSEAKGCVGNELYVFHYDAEVFWSNITVHRGFARGPFFYPDTAAKVLDVAGNAPTVTIASLFSSTVHSAGGWAEDGGLTMWVADAGSTTTAYGGAMFGAGPFTLNDILIESDDGSQDGLVSNFMFRTEDSACLAQATMSNIRRYTWLGDSLSANVPITEKIPEGAFRRASVNGTNLAQGNQKFVGGVMPCTRQWAQGGNGTYDSVVVWCGVNDLLSGAADAGFGTDLFTAEKAWIEEMAYRGIRVLWLDVTPFKAYDSSAGKIAARNLFNATKAAYCAAPATNVTCTTVSQLIWDPADHDALLPSCTSDGLHFTSQTCGDQISAHVALSLAP